MAIDASERALRPVAPLTSMFESSDGRDAGIGSRDGRALIFVGLAAAFLGAASFVYAVATYQRGGGTPTFLKTVVTWLLLAAPIAVVVGGFLYTFSAARRSGLRLLMAGLGVVLGFVGLFALVMLLVGALTR